MFGQELAGGDDLVCIDSLGRPIGTANCGQRLVGAGSDSNGKCFWGQIARVGWLIRRRLYGVRQRAAGASCEHTGHSTRRLGCADLAEALEDPEQKVAIAGGAHDPTGRRTQLLHDLPGDGLVAINSVRIAPDWWVAKVARWVPPEVSHRLTHQRPAKLWSRQCDEQPAHTFDQRTKRGSDLGHRQAYRGDTETSAGRRDGRTMVTGRRYDNHLGPRLPSVSRGYPRQPILVGVGLPMGLVFHPQVDVEIRAEPDDAFQGGMGRRRDGDRQERPDGGLR